MASDFKQDVIFDNIIEIEGLGKIPLKYDASSQSLREIYWTALKESRGILPPELVEIGDPIAIFYLIVATAGYFDPTKISQIKDRSNNAISSDIATKVVASARRYHMEAAAAAATEALAITIVDGMFKTTRDPLTRRPIIVAADGINLPAIPNSYWDDEEVNTQREMLNLPPLFPKNPDNVAEIKLAYYSTAVTTFPDFATTMRDVLRSNIVAEIQQQLAEGVKGDEVDPNTGFHSGGTDTHSHDENDAVSE